MQSCGRTARRFVCVARNAYSPANALRCAFGTISRRRQDGDDNDATASRRQDGDDNNTTASRRHDEDDNNATASRRHNEDGNNATASEPSQAPQDGRSETPARLDKLGKPIRSHRADETASALRWIDRELRVHEHERNREREPRERLSRQDPVDFHADRSSRALTYLRNSTTWQALMLELRHRAMALDTFEGRKKLAGLSDSQKDTLRQSFDYTPRAIPLHASTMKPSMPVPWALTDVERGKLERAHEILSMEIKRFEQYMTPTPVERAARQAIADELVNFITVTLEHRGPRMTGIELFGSEKTELAMPISDIDVRVFDVTNRPQTINRMGNRMSLLLAAIRKSDKYIAPVLRNHGRYPIINCQHRESGIDIQIVASTDTTRQQDVTAHYLAEMPHLRALFYIVRTMFAMRGLLDVYTGGLGSYGSFVLLLAALNRSRGKFRVKRRRFLAVELRRFLYLYGDEMEPHKYGIAVTPRTRFLKHDADKMYHKYSELAGKRGDPIRAAQWTMCQRRPLQPWLLTLQDPADPNNDLGKRSNAIKHILTTMKRSGGEMRMKLKEFSSCLIRGVKWQEESVLLSLVGRCHEYYHGPRERLRQYGERVLKEGGGWVNSKNKEKEGKQKNKDKLTGEKKPR